MRKTKKLFPALLVLLLFLASSCGQDDTLKEIETSIEATYDPGDEEEDDSPGLNQGSETFDPGDEEEDDNPG